MGRRVTRGEHPGAAGTTIVEIALRLGVLGPVFAVVGVLLADALTGALAGISGPLVFAVVWGAISYRTIRRLRSRTPRWKAGAGGVLSALWSAGSRAILVSAVLLLFFSGGSSHWLP